MSITVDTNDGESAVFDAISAKATCPVNRKRLDVGDFLIETEHGSIIVERKHVPDLISSIRDGRYREQRARQLAAVAADETGKTAVVWVVEGPLSAWHSVHKPTNFSNSQLEAAVISTAVRDGIPILRALNAEAVAETVLYLFKRMAAGELSGDAKAQKRAAEGYAGSTHVKKSKNMDGDMVFKMMLATIPGVSIGKAASVIAAYPNPAALVDMIRSRPEKAAIKELAAIECGTRKLGPAVGTKIVQVFK